MEDKDKKDPTSTDNERVMGFITEIAPHLAEMFEAYQKNLTERLAKLEQVKQVIEKDRIDRDYTVKVKELELDELLTQQEINASLEMANINSQRLKYDRIFKVIVLVLVLTTISILMLANKEVGPITGFFGLIIGAVFGGDVINRVSDRSKK